MSLIAQRLASRVLLSPRLSEKATLITYAAGDYNSYGEWEDGAKTETSIDVVTAPLSGQERQNLPEGLRERAVRKFWTSATASITPGQTQGTQIRYRNTLYRVVGMQDWRGFREIMAVRPEATV